MDEQTNEVFFMVLGAAMFIMALCLLLRYERSFYRAYEELYQRSGNEYVMPE